MIWAIILIVLAIVIAPILLPVLIGATGLLFTFYKEAFTDPNVLAVVFATIGAVWFLGCLAKGRGERLAWRGKEKRIGLSVTPKP